MLNLLLLLNLTVAVAPPTDLPVLDQPFGHVSFADRAVDYLADVNNELRLEAQLNEKEWPKRGAPDPEDYLTKSRREGVLLYYATDGVVRTLPKGVVPMFGGLFGINPDRLPPLPYRAVWYSVLDADEEFADWLSDYARKYNWANVSYTPIYDPDFPDRAKIRVTHKNPFPVAPAVSPAQSYRLFGGLQSKRSHEATIRKVGRVVFRSEFSELRQLKLEQLARKIERESADWVCTVNPSGLPREQLQRLSDRIKQVAAPRLQQFDEEADAQYRTRVLARRWLLDATDALGRTLRSASVRVDGIVSREAPFRFQLQVDSSQGAAPRLFGASPVSAAREVDLSVASVDDESTELGGFVLAGTLPKALQQSLKDLIGTTENQRLQNELLAWVDSKKYPIAIRLLRHGERFVVVGGVACDQATGIVDGLRELVGEKGPLVVLRDSADQANATKDGEGYLPREFGVVAKGKALVFAFADEKVREVLEAASTRVKSSAQRRLIDFDLDLAALAAVPRSQGFDSVPALILDLVERQAFELGVMASNSSTASEVLPVFLMAHELTGEIGDSYLKTLEEHVHRTNRKFNSAETWRGALAEGQSQIHLEMRVSPESVKVDIKVGRAAHRFLVGQFYEAGK